MFVEKELSMASLSRRDALRAGVLTTALAGGAVAGAPAASAAKSEKVAAAEAVVFPEGTEFTGSARGGNGQGGVLTITFKVSSFELTEDVNQVMVAQLLAEFVQSKGLTPITFWGTPPAAELDF
jgi:hypothetical protein